MHEQHLVHVIGHGGGVGGGGGGVLIGARSGGVDHNVTFTPPPVVPVDDGGGNGAVLSGGVGGALKLIVEAPPVTELVTETPLENGLSSSALGVIGGKWSWAARPYGRTFFIADKGFPPARWEKKAARTSDSWYSVEVEAAM